jgi:hypothetical protein
MRWSGIKNGQLLLRSARKFDVFLTLDRSIRHQQVLPERLAMLTLRVKANTVAHVLALAADVLEALERIQPGEIVFVGENLHSSCI